MAHSITADALRSAMGLVRQNPDAIAELEKADRKAAEEAERAAQAKLSAQAKLEKAMPARVEALVADWHAREAEAVRLAAEQVARKQLAHELGLTDPHAVMQQGLPARVGPSRVDGIRSRLAEEAPLPWVKGTPAADQWRATQTRNATELVEGGADDVEARVAAKQAQLRGGQAHSEADRQAQIAARKRAAGIPGW
jgi:hypothetical protein